MNWLSHLILIMKPFKNVSFHIIICRGLMKFIFYLGSMKLGWPIHHFPTLACNEAVSAFVEKMMPYVMLLNERLWHFFAKKKKDRKKSWCQFLVPLFAFFSLIWRYIIYPNSATFQSGSIILIFINDNWTSCNQSHYR